MNTFKILPSTSKPTAQSRAFGQLNPELPKYVPATIDLLDLSQYFGGINKQYLSLHHLSLNPAVALKRLGCENTDELLKATSYICGFTGESAGLRHCLVPLGVVINDLRGLRKYDEAFDTHAKDGTGSHVLHLLPDNRRFWPENLQDSVSEEGDLDYKVTRFEQLYLGCGFTREMLADPQRRPTMRLYPVTLRLSNEDMLLAYAYKAEGYVES